MADAPKSGEPAAESPSAQPPDAGPPAGAGGASGAGAPPQSAGPAAESSAGPPAEPSSAAAASKPAPVEPKPSAAKPAVAERPAAVAEKPAAAKPKPAAVAAKPAAARPRPKPKPKAPPEAPKGPVDPPPPEDLEKPAFLIALEAALPDRIQQISYWVGDWTVIVAPEALLEVGAFLKDSDEGSFDYCADLTATDWPPREKRFDVVYCLYSTRRRQRVRIKVQAAGGEAVPSVTGLWPAANWLEREVWDMFGVNVTGHPDLRRILMPPAWQGHPQRKDYPLEGPGELLLESPMEWLRLRNVRDEAEIE
jgi:NADH-quinone oxidoreductase subunit C